MQLINEVLLKIGENSLSPFFIYADASGLIVSVFKHKINDAHFHHNWPSFCVKCASSGRGGLELAFLFLYL